MLDRSEVETLRRTYDDADTATLAGLTSDIAWRIEAVTADLEAILETDDGAGAYDAIYAEERARRSALAEWAADPPRHPFPIEHDQDAHTFAPTIDCDVVDKVRVLVDEVVILTACYDLIIEQLQARKLLPARLTSRPARLDLIDWWMDRSVA